MKIILKQEIRLQVIATTILGTLTLMLGSNVANAVTVYFNDADRGPSDVLQIGALTVSQFQNPQGQPTTVAGSGLGADWLGPDDSINYQADYAVGQSLPNDYGTGQANWETLAITASGDVNIQSITLLPHFPIVTQTGASTGCDFAASIFWDGWADYKEVVFDPANPGPVTINLKGGLISGVPVQDVLISLDADFGGTQPDWQAQNFLYPYRMNNLGAEQTLQCGVTVVSLDYTPVSEPGIITFVAEPGTMSFLALGLIGLLRHRRGRWSQLGIRSFVAKDVKSLSYADVAQRSSG